MPKGKYRKWSEVPEYKKQIIDTIREVAEENKIFSLNQVYERCLDKKIELPRGKHEIANSFSIMVSEAFDYARVLRQTSINSVRVTLCQSYIYQGGKNE